MREDELRNALSGYLSSELADAITKEYVATRNDLRTSTFGRTSPGKFVEIFVQCMQYLSTGSYETAPSVDNYLNSQLEHQTSIPSDLRLAAGRIARGMYTLRNKRNIAHIGSVDPNSYDLSQLHSGAAWIVSELLRQSTSISMETAGKLVEQLYRPVGDLIEEIDGELILHFQGSQKQKI